MTALIVLNFWRVTGYIILLKSYKLFRESGPKVRQNLDNRCYVWKKKILITPTKVLGYSRDPQTVPQRARGYKNMMGQSKKKS